VQVQESNIEKAVKKTIVTSLLGAFPKSQRKNIEPDLYTVMEAGAIIDRLRANPELIDDTFSFLTNNMSIVNALRDKTRIEEMEKAFTANGIKHVISVQPLSEI